MSSPIYTATGQATAGPADPNAPTRVKSYAVLSALVGLIPVLTVFKVLTTDQGVAVGQFVQSAIGLAGAFGFAFVANKTNKQVHNGTFKEAPANPVGNVFDQLAEIKAGVDQTAEYAATKAVDAATLIQGALANIPGGALVSGAIKAGPAGDLLQWLSDHPEQPPQ